MSSFHARKMADRYSDYRPGSQNRLRLASSVGAELVLTLDTELFNHPFIQSALFTAAEVHGFQMRRGPEELPYLSHLTDVAMLTSIVYPNPAVVAAALLHDCVEDTSLGYDEIRQTLNTQVAELVFWLTDAPVSNNRNRALRKRDTSFRLSLAPQEALIIKTADLLSNLPGLRDHDPVFYRVYREEAVNLLPILYRQTSAFRPTLLHALETQLGQIP